MMELLLWASGAALSLLLFFTYYLFRQSKTLSNALTTFPRSRPSKVQTKKTGRRYLVIGGHGFLGSHIVEALLARGEDNILVFDAVESTLFDDEQGVSFMRGNILDPAQLDRACDARQVVFHTAAMLNYWSRLAHDYDRVYQINYVGTVNVIDACLKAGVHKLLFPSSATIFVSADALDRPIRGLSEDEVIYPEGAPLCHYTHTKMLAERAVLAANGSGEEGQRLATGVLRPNAIYGPRDLFSNLIGKGYPGVGTPSNVQDYAYVENVVHAFLKLEEALEPGSDAPAAGQAFFVSDDAPVRYLEFASQFGDRFGRPFRIIPHGVATVVAHVVETLTRLSAGRVWLGQLTVLTPPTLVVSRAEYHFSVEKAKRMLGWRPLFTPEQGIDLSVRYHASLENESKMNVAKKEKKRE